MSTLIKICGLSTQDSVDTAVEAGADMVGFVFFERSPRAVSPAHAGALGARVPDTVERVGLIVDATDDEIATILQKATLDVLQLHGSESVARVADVSNKFKLPVMKALAISEPADLDLAQTYEDVADALLFDAKPPKGATRPGGNAVTFDWTILNNYSGGTPWLLAGGITPENVGDALRISGAPGVDVSSAIEQSPGVKDNAKIVQFIKAVKSV